VARAPGDVGEAVVEVPAAARHYVHVAPAGGAGIVASTRLVALEGTLNFRDIGGYRGREGRRVRWGRVFRSDGLQDLTDNDLATLRHLGIRVVHDFRYDLERERRPSRLPTDGSVIVEGLTIGGEAGQEREMLDLVMAGEVTEIGDDFMAEMYVEMLETGAGSFGRLLTSISDPDRLPALFHCTAGKDRTGVAAGLLLSLLGVDEETILDDYELSTRYRSARRIEELRPRLEAAGVDVDKVRPFLSAPRPALAAALAAIHERHGSVEGYLVERAGVQEATIDRLREHLLD
jgi:protein-tyrosine phosphatase